MAGWKAILSNDEVRSETTLESWRGLVAHCKMHNLCIKKFEYNGEEIDKNADAFIVIHQITVTGLLTTSPQSDMRKGIVSIRRKKNGCQARILWYNANEPHNRLYREVVRNFSQNMIDEFAIERE
jgi:hypothetical protein